MTFLLLIVLVIAVPVIAGFINSRKQRRVDRRHFAAFLGFSAGLVSVVATTISFTVAILWFRPPQLPYFHPSLQGVAFISSSIGLISSGVAFLGGSVQ